MFRAGKIDALREGLQSAVRELLEHNREYHHRTLESELNRLQKLVDEAIA